MITILFLYVVGYLIGLGVDLETGTFQQHPRWVVYLGNTILWPITIGKAIAK